MKASNTVSAEDWRAMEAGKKKHSKMRNVRSVTDGINFASKKEARKYGELKLLKEVGHIKDFSWQIRYKLYVKTTHICDYIADFIVYHNDGTKEVVDCKGYKKHQYVDSFGHKKTSTSTAYLLFTIKKKWMKALYDIDVKEV